MSSYGENEIQCSSFTIGKVRVLNIHAAQAIFPRLGMTVGIGLYDVSTGQHSPLKFAYEMIDITGELRLKESQDIVGSIAWTGARGAIQCLAQAHESQIHMSCDLDLQRLEQIERWRNGTPPTFWVQFWPLLVAEGKRVPNVEARAFRVDVPREAWLDFYSKVGGRQFDVLEIQFSPRTAGQFQAALGHLRKAREKISNGDYDAAVETCRKAVEAMLGNLPEPTGDNAQLSEGDRAGLKRFLASRLDEKRATAYSGIQSHLKALMNRSVHAFGTDPIYSRAEANFIVRTTESLLMLLGNLTADL